MTNWTPPPELLQPTPRKVAPSKVFWQLNLSIAAIFGLLASVMSVSLCLVLRDAQILQTRGVRVTATVVSIDQTSSKFNDVQYNFAVPGNTGAATLVYSGKDSRSVDESAGIYSGGPIDVVYDPNNPSLSEIDIDDSVRRFPIGWTNWVGALFMWPISIICVGSVAAYAWYKYAVDAALLKSGGAAPATITDEVMQAGSKGGRYVVALYSFLDGSGNVVHGKMRYPPLRKEPYLASDGTRKWVIDNPAALYSPADSRRNTLFPPVWAKLV